MSKYILSFKDISINNLAEVGGKNASLGEMTRKLAAAGISIPNGFAITAVVYKQFLVENKLEIRLKEALAALDKTNLSNLAEIGLTCRQLIKNATFPGYLQKEIEDAYRSLGNQNVAVRSSATAEDLPSASFAGQHDSFLNISGEQQLLEAVQQCYVSLFNDRAIKYREDNGFDHMNVFLSVGVQWMVRADKGAAGVAFTIDPEYGNKNLIYITGAWGLGEAVVQGAVTPDEYYIFKPALSAGKKSLIYRHAGDKKDMMIFNAAGTLPPVVLVSTPQALRKRYVLDEDEVTKLAEWCNKIEQHYQMPMDIEWAKDGITGDIYILQARPETVQSKEPSLRMKQYIINAHPTSICSGKAVGRSIVSGRVCIVQSLADAPKVQPGDIIVADITSPDWNALLKKAVSIVTNKGGRTSHASIVARELGIPAVVGTIDATAKLHDGQQITVSCAEGDTGYVYDGRISWETRETATKDLIRTKTKHMMILSDPDKAISLSVYPSDGVGLLRIEFIISNHVQVHPMAIVHFDNMAETPDKKTIATLCSDYKNKSEYFISKLSEGIAMVAAAFYPREVIVRTSDFKTNEYAQLLGGKYFEPQEENPMLGFRGASRYYNPRYKEGFGLECAAIKEVRDTMGLTNVKIMIPFCRTVEEGERVLSVLQEYGLERGKNGLEVYIMAEIPSNVILADKFAKLFDGFSIGSNDLTQLTLGLDRDSAIVSDLFDENNDAVKTLLSQVIDAAKRNGRKIGLCGQAPSDFPDFSRFLVQQGIDSISFNPDALISGIENILTTEQSASKPAKAYPILFPEAAPNK